MNIQLVQVVPVLRSVHTKIVEESRFLTASLSEQEEEERAVERRVAQKGEPPPLSLARAIFAFLLLAPYSFTRVQAHGSTFIALIAELWMSKFVTDTLHVRGGGPCKQLPRPRDDTPHSRGDGRKSNRDIP